MKTIFLTTLVVLTLLAACNTVPPHPKVPAAFPKVPVNKTLPDTRELLQ